MLGVFLFIGQMRLGAARAAETPASPDGVQASSSSADSADPPSPSSTISDDEIEGFLFHIRDTDLWQEIKKLDADPVLDLKIPILFGITPDQLDDTFNAPRAGGKKHRAIDILAPRGSFIVSPTDAIVTNIGYNNKGGSFVLTANPGGEQYYYAHLDEYAHGLVTGLILKPGDLIGYVGNTGGAQRTVSHLHFAIYYKGVAVNPYPRLTKQFSLEEQVAALTKIIDKSDTALSDALQIIDAYSDLLIQAQVKGLVLPDMIKWVLENNDVLSKARMLGANIPVGSKGENVRLLQELLIRKNAGPTARALARAGASGYFGPLTQRAITEYQKAIGITPASGRFGPTTRAHMLSLLTATSTPAQMAAETPQTMDMDIVSKVASADTDLAVGSKGEIVRWLQQLLIDAKTGPAAEAVARTGATGHFGPITKKALAEYQVALGITPAQGYFGPATKARLQEISKNPSSF